MRKLLLVAFLGALVFRFGVVFADDRKLITSYEFEEKLSNQPAKEETQKLKLRGIITKPRLPEVTVYILFKFGSAEIADDFSKRQLDEAGKALSSDLLSKYRFEVAGHTDSIGSDEFNQRLSEKRANVIKENLSEKYGIPEERLGAKGYVESMPDAPNDTESGRAKNRRVVFKRLD